LSKEWGVPKGSLSGWGATTHGGPSVAGLRGLDLPIISDGNANTLLASPNNTCTNPPPVNDDYLAFFDVAGKSAAQGDSGGPATINNGTLLIGVHSWGGCPRDEFPSVYTDIRPFTDFIEDHINQPGGNDEYINENTLIDTDQDFHGNLIVQEGFELTITATVRFTEGHGINVERGAKLHLNGGTLTKHCSAPDWKGINVEGNSGLAQPSSPFTMPAANEAGVVLLTKNSQEVPATIEWARNAISTTKFGQSWNSSYWGGLVHCENSQFINCRRAAEFMKYDKTNKSQFINCTFKDDLPGENNGTIGVTIWDTDGINFNQCTFSNLDASGILIWDAGCNIRNGCTFTGNRRAVQSNATSTVSSGFFLRIEPIGGAANTFENNDFMDVELRASSLNKNVRIFNNLFKDTYDYGIWLDGRNSANIRNNTFTNKDFAITGQNIGFGYTTIYCNDLSQNVELGILLENDNQRTKFLKNNFETNWLDFVLFGYQATGSVHPDQGAFNAPAGNCFSAAHLEHIVTLPPTASFNYHTLSSNPPLCQVPQPSGYGTNNYTIVPDADPPLPPEDCGLDLDGDPEAEGPYHYDDYLTVKQEYLALKAQLDADPNNVQLLGETLQKEEEKEGVIA
jgi:trypsin/parallel beta helix pectate lyase-like protein